MKIKVKQYNYKLELNIKKQWFQISFLLSRKIQKIMNNFPNYNMYWENNNLIINIYFDSTGWEKDKENLVTDVINLYEVGE